MHNMTAKENSTQVLIKEHLGTFEVVIKKHCGTFLLRRADNYTDAFLSAKTTAEKNGYTFVR